MAIITTGNNFGATDAVTSTTLNNIANAATFDDPVDGTSLELKVDGKLGIKGAGEGVIDDDTMGTATATNLATSESIKAYVDNGRFITNRKRVSSTSNLTISSIIPLDDTAPEVVEGGQVLSTTFTPGSTDNKILVEFNGLAGLATVAQGMIMAVFEGNVCKGAQWWSQPSNGINVCHITFEFTPGTTSEVNYSLRFGPGSSGTGYINRQSNAEHTLGGLQEYSMTISEIQS